MGFNYGKERRKMEQKFSDMAKKCRDEGMSEENIDEIRELLKEELNSNRSYYTNTQPHNYSDNFDEDEGVASKQSKLIKKFKERLSIDQQSISEWSRLSWIDDIDDPDIALWLKSQPDRDIEFLTLRIVDDMTQTKIAELWGCSDSAISGRKKRLQKSLKKFRSKG